MAMREEESMQSRCFEALWAAVGQYAYEWSSVQCVPIFPCRFACCNVDLAFLKNSENCPLKLTEGHRRIMIAHWPEIYRMLCLLPRQSTQHVVVTFRKAELVKIGLIADSAGKNPLGDLNCQS